MRNAMQILQDAGGVITVDVKAALSKIGLTDEQIDMFAEMQNRFAGGNRAQGGLPPGGVAQGGMAPGGFQMGGGDQNAMPRGFPAGGGDQNAMPGGVAGVTGGAPNGAVSATAPDRTYIITTAILLAVLAGATVFIAKPSKNAV